MFQAEIEFLKALEQLRTGFLNTFFECVTVLGEETVAILLMAVIYFLYDKKLVYRIFFLTATSLSVNHLIKNFVKLPRPFFSGKVSCVRAETATGYSFPSGHTQNFSTWSFSFGLYLKKHWLTISALFLTILIAFSRMYLGAHYPIDVLIGALLGFFFAIAGNIMYDKIENKNILRLAVVLILLPFAVYFSFRPDPLYADFYKCYGLQIGLFLVVPFEEKFIQLSFDCSLGKKILRVFIGLILAFTAKILLKKLCFSTLLPLSFLLDCLRYFLLIVIVLGIYPLILKKLNI
ncbi:MAG: phosphatase PAP2 family protein [Ruminococcaceae bacterium]|nr:phosphatase PAP2 family protein [Oscillospiraceae bacterium]